MIVYKIDKELQDTLIILAQKLNKKDYSKVVGAMNLLYMGCSMGLGENPTELLMISKDIYNEHKFKKPNAKILTLVKK